MPAEPQDRRPATGRALLLKALDYRQMSATPWIPFAGVHSGKLKGYSAREVLTDADKLFESLLAVNKVYDPDGQPIAFDLQVEAEILGCDLAWAETAPPSVAAHPLAGRPELPDRLPQPDDGRLPLLLDVTRRMNDAVGEHTALLGLVTGPLTLAAHLRGTELFMDTFDRPDFVSDLLAYTRRVAQRMADLYLEAGVHVVAYVDPMVSQISPKAFEQFLDAPYRALFQELHRRDVPGCLFVCGDATKNLAGMCHTAPDAIFVDENIDMAAAQEITAAHQVALGGNVPLTTRMLLGNQQDNMQYALSLLDTLDRRGLIIAPGCDMPYDTPIENVIALVQAVRNPEATRNMLANYQAPGEAIDVTLPDYDKLDRPLVEVFTLDSDTCAACTYMKRVVFDVAEAMQGAIDAAEYKFTTRENMARMKKLGVAHLPCVYINGELAYSSLIPSKGELMERLRREL